MLGGRVLHAVFKAHHVDVLRHHVDDKVGGKTLGAVVEPLDDVAIAKRRNAHGAAVVVDLRVVLGDLELRNHVGKLAELAVAELLRAVAVEHGDAVVGDLSDLLGEAAAFNGKQRLIVLRAQHDPGHQRADKRCDNKQRRDEKRHGALLFDEGEVALRARALKAGGQKRADAVGEAQQQCKAVKLLGVQVDGGQFKIEKDRADEQRDKHIDRDAAALAADRLSGFALALGLGRGVLVELKAVCVRTGKFDIHRIVLPE